MSEKRSEHFDLGYKDYQLGNPYYSFQDGELQKEYDKGWEAAKDNHLVGYKEHRFKFVQKSAMPGAKYRTKYPDDD
jgi:hypothetical protein